MRFLPLKESLSFVVIYRYVSKGVVWVKTFWGVVFFNQDTFKFLTYCCHMWVGDPFQSFLIVFGCFV